MFATTSAIFCHFLHFKVVANNITIAIRNNLRKNALTDILNFSLAWNRSKFILSSNTSEFFLRAHIAVWNCKQFPLGNNFETDGTKVEWWYSVQLIIACYKFCDVLYFQALGQFFEAYGQILTEKGTLAGKRTDGKLTSKCLVMIVNFEA